MFHSLWSIDYTNADFSEEIAMHSAIIHLAENANIILEETSTYPSSSFLSDTGGALGKYIQNNIHL